MEGLSKTLARNALYGGAARTITLAVGLVVTPYLLSRLGPDRFGIWALATVATGAIGLLDLSFRTSFVKYLAEMMALEDLNAVRSIISTGFFLYLSFSVVVTFALFLGLNLWVVLLKIPDEFLLEAKHVFLIGAAGYLMSSVLSVFPAVCDAMQRMDITNSLGVAALVASTLLMVLVVESGLGVRGVALAQLTGIAAFHVASVFAARALLGGLGLSTARVSRYWLFKMFPFGLKLHVSSTCVIVNRQLDKFLLSAWAGLPLVSSYEVALRVVGNAGSLQPYLASALLPASSQLNAIGDRQRLVNVYQKASRYLFLAGIPPFVYLGVHCGPIISAWLGRAEPMATTVLLILTAGYMVNALSNGMAFVCQGIGRPGIQAEQSALQLTANVVLSVVLLHVIGPLGAPLGTSCALLLGAIYFARRFHRHLGISTLTLLREQAIVPFTASVLGVFSAWPLTAHMAQSTRSEAIFKLAVSGLVFLIVLGGTCFLLGFVGKAEMGYLRSVLQMRRKQAKIW